MSYLSLDEMACKDEERSPYPAEWVDKRFRRLEGTFNAIRRAWGAPIVVISGYRTPEYNSQIGGAERSQHVQGRAADIRPAHLPQQIRDWEHTHFARVAELWQVIHDMHAKSELPELGGLGRYKTFVHIDVRPTDGRLATWWA